MIASPNRRARRILLHVVRAGLLAIVLALIHWRHVQRTAQRADQAAPPLAVSDVVSLFPRAASLDENADAPGARDVFDAAGGRLGYVLQTSPDSDHIIGFSGPTNGLIALAPDDTIVGVKLLSSGDTRDHVRQVRKDDLFLDSFRGMTRTQVAARSDLDAVSGATLTSLAVRESIVHRLGGAAQSLRFPNPLTAKDARRLFPGAASVERDALHESLWHVFDARRVELGAILRTSPAADNIVGYQGPTESRIAFDLGGRVIGLAIGDSYDNEPYVTYVRDDEYFLSLFNDLMLKELAELDPEASEVEGVSGATMTSLAVAEGLIAAARKHREALAAVERRRADAWSWKWRDLGTAVVIALGLAIGLTRLRSIKRVRVSYQLILIVYLGLINGDMISQAMLVGWARHGIPWRHAGGLILLTFTAFVVPLGSRRNIYCTHLCPHGAAQQLLKRRVPWQLRLPARWSSVLRIAPVLLLAWCVMVGVLGLSFSLVDIEPFDAWVFRVAGWATITIAILGLAASLFVPMAYCRFGCPTGAVLDFLRFNSGGDSWTMRDWVALGMVLLAGGLALVV